MGYRYENGFIIRIDSELLHREVTRPAIALLRSERFEGALDEFMEAHEHLRKGETKEANVDALNALESTIKTICDGASGSTPRETRVPSSSKSS